MKVTDTDLVLYAEQKIEPLRLRKLLQHAKQDARFAKTLSSLRLSRVPYKQAFDSKELIPLPDALRKEVRELLRQSTSQVKERERS
jgi:hypothetical protein